MRIRSTRYAAAALLAAASVLAVPAALPAEAAAGPLDVTLTLAAPHPAALAALAADTTTPTDVRRARLAALLPSSAAHETVTRILGAKGFQVLNQSTWTVTVRAPQTLVNALFGVLPINPATLTQALAPFPHIPTALAGLVRVASPTTAAAPAWKSKVVQPLTQYAIRNAYTAPRVAPGAGKNPNGPLTVATIQFSGWNHDDLARYAARIGRPDPIATKQLRTVKVDGGATGTAGQVEVGLDQEALLATSPYSHQQLYSAPNTTAGFNDAFSAVLDDALANGHATSPNRRIAALSISWGGCEASTGGSNMAAAEPILQSLVAAGVNIFSATGDGGIYDCGNSAGGLLGLGGPPGSAIDYPASSKYVVAVGGTRAESLAHGAANSGTNWAEWAWSCTSRSSCTGSGGGTGGGQSMVFGAPTYQRSYVTSAPFANRGRRLTPDIAAIADPASGLTIVTSDPQAGGGGLLTVGGTSLAAPVSAGLFVDLLASLGRTRGVGDIHPGIYRAAAAKKVVRDITKGSNGDPADAGSDPRVTAGIGYDTVTGVGAVLWSGMAGYLPR